MSMKILITSDSHDRWDYLKLAIEKGKEEGCEVMLFAGDFIAPSGISVLKEFNGQIHFVLGNNDGELVGLTRMLDANENTILHYKFGESTMKEEFGGLKFYMNHYPNIVQNVAKIGEFDVCIYGHNHIYYEEVLENGTILLNPGDIQGHKTGIATCMIFDTQTKKVSMYGSVTEKILRVGLAFAFLYPAVSALFNPFAWVGYFPPFLLDLVGSNSILLLHTFGITEVIIALWLFFGKKVFYPSVIASLYLLAIVVLNISQMDIVFRDLSILTIAIALAWNNRDDIIAEAPTI